jgi:hypothetical protein
VLPYLKKLDVITVCNLQVKGNVALRSSPHKHERAVQTRCYYNVVISTMHWTPADWVFLLQNTTESLVLNVVHTERDSEQRYWFSLIEALQSGQITEFPSKLVVLRLAAHFPNM